VHQACHLLPLLRLLLFLLPKLPCPRAAYYFLWTFVGCPASILPGPVPPQSCHQGPSCPTGSARLPSPRLHNYSQHASMPAHHASAATPT